MHFAVKRILTAAGFVSVTLASTHAWAWGDIGHGAVGYIADKFLSPQARHLVFSIVGPEPLAVSATWPDAVRSAEQYKPFGAFHFFEIPQDYTASTIPNNRRVESDASTILTQVPELLVGSKASREQKMVLLRFLVHVVGDVHQPLHIGNGVDRGANLCDVYFPNPESGYAKLSSLHAVLDDHIIGLLGHEYKRKNPTPGGTDPHFGYKEFGDIILSEINPASSAAQKAGLDFGSANRSSFNQWYDESRALHAQVYPDRAPVENPEDRAYCKVVDKQGKVINGKYERSKVPKLDGEYVKKVLPLIKRQVLLAGLRLAGLLNKISNGRSGMGPAQEAAILGKIVLKNTQTRSPQSGEKPEALQPAREYPGH